MIRRCTFIALIWMLFGGPAAALEFQPTYLDSGPVGEEIFSDTIEEPPPSDAVEAPPPAGKPAAQPADPSEDVPPILRTIQKRLEKQFIEDDMDLSQEELQQELDLAYTDVLETLREKANIEFMPEKAKLCPGVVDKIWAANCKDKKEYALNDENRFMESTYQMLCFLDHPGQAPQKCR